MSTFLSRLRRLGTAGRALRREALEMLRAALLLAVIVLAIYGAVRLLMFGGEALAAARFRAFSSRIAATDHLVVTNRAARPQAFTIAGEDARKVVRAVSSSRRYILPPDMEDASIYGDHLTFFAGTNALGNIPAAGSLFIVNGKKYRDDTGVVRTLVIEGHERAHSEWLSSMTPELTK